MPSRRLSWTRGPHARRVARQKLRRRGKNFGRGQVGHAAVVERTDAKLARAAGNLLVQMDGPRVVGFGPGNVGRPKEGHDRPPKAGSEMTRAAVGSHKQVGAANTSFREPQRQQL